MKLHPLQGELVIAKPSGWDDDSEGAPLLEGVAKTLAGVLHCHLIKLPTVSYVKCIVGGYDVDPDTITAADTRELPA